MPLPKILVFAGSVRAGSYNARLAALAVKDGGMRSLLALRQVLEFGCGALVIPEQVVIPHVSAAFDEIDNLNDERVAALLKTASRRLVEMAQQEPGQMSEAVIDPRDRLIVALDLPSVTPRRRS